MRTRLLAFAALALLACDGEPAPSPPAGVQSAPAPPPAPPPATVLGKVCFRGKPPPPYVYEVTKDEQCGSFVPPGKLEVQRVNLNGNGTLKDAFVYISKGLEGQVFPVPSEPATFGYEGCRMVPRVFGVRARQEVLLEEDRAGKFPHKIHCLPKNPKTPGSGRVAENSKRCFRTPEIGLKLQCEIHPWEAAYAHVMAHPFFAVTGGDGEFRIDGIPPGRYTLSVWHDVLGQRDVEVQLDPGETWVIDFDYEGS